jgi:hypothetical protein
VSYLKDTTITSSSSTRFAPLYPELAELPLVKAPPYIHIKTAFLLSPLCGFVHTFKLKQSSSNVELEVLNLVKYSKPVEVRFADAIDEGVILRVEAATGQDGP